MFTEPLTEIRREEFLEYCRLHRKEVDDSFLSEEEMALFRADERNPTYVLIDDTGRIVGAASLVATAYFRRGRRARFRILHSELATQQSYRVLLAAIRPHVHDLERVFLFVKAKDQHTAEVLSELGFREERRSYLLECRQVPQQRLQIPDGLMLRSFRFGQDEADWCRVRNAAFAHLKGSETPVTPEMISAMADWEETIPDGMVLLYDGQEPIAAVRVAQEVDEGDDCAFIGPLAVVPEYQGRGLGRIMLRVGLRVAEEAGFSRVLLSVNAENSRALRLYLSEGFTVIEELICLNLQLTEAPGLPPDAC